MKHGKREMPRSRNCKGRTALIALALVFCCSVGGTLAWLITTSGPVENTFTPAHVDCEVLEDSFGGTTKSGVLVHNTSDVSAYIRAALVPTWVDDKGNIVAKPASLDDLTIQYNESDWKQSGEYWYCTSPIPAGGDTPVLITSATVKAENGYHMDLQILAEAIQADGVNSSSVKAVKDAWGVDPTTLLS